MDSIVRNDECFECGAPAVEDHHVIPRSRGGTKTVPLCAACHNLVHDRDGNRTDSVATLIAEGHSLPRARSHQQVLRALRREKVRVAEPPQLVKDRTVAGMSYEEWRPWLDKTLRTERELREKVRAALEDN